MGFRLAWSHDVNTNVSHREPQGRMCSLEECHIVRHTHSLSCYFVKPPYHIFISLPFLHEVLSQFVADPRQSHLIAIVWMVWYLKATPGQWVLLPREGGNDLLAYCDYDWLGCPLTRRSRTSYVLLFGGEPISWKKEEAVCGFPVFSWSWIPIHGANNYWSFMD